MFRKTLLTGAMAALIAAPAFAQRPAVTPAMAPFVSQDAPVIALIHARVIDGAGGPVQEGQTLLLREGRIAWLGPDRQATIPAEAKVVDLNGKTVLPGLVQLHEHLWMFGGSLLSVSDSYPKLLLAAGVTSIRTAGSLNPYIDLRTRKAIETGAAVGPWMDLSIYMDLFGAPRLTSEAETRKYLSFWLDSGFTSVKAYGYTNKAALKAAIALAHARGLKVTGHLCMVTYREAAELGIDDIEHGFAMAPDFVPAELAAKPAAEGTVDTKAEQDCGVNALHGLENADPDGPLAKALIATLVARKVAVTSTLPALEDLLADPPPQPGVDMLSPPILAYHQNYRARMRTGEGGTLRLSPEAIRKTVLLERAFMRAGGLLVSGTDPAVPSGGVIAGYASARQLELMVQYGFTPLEAIRVSTLNGAIYLGRDRDIGTVTAGKQADLLVVDGDPSKHIADVGKVAIVFKQGVGYDPEKLRAAVRGKVGLQ